MVLILCALGCTDPQVNLTSVDTKPVAVELPPGNPPILIDRTHLPSGWYRMKDLVHWLQESQEVEVECSYAVIEAATLPHREDGSGAWGRMFWVMFTWSSPVHWGASYSRSTWASVGDTVFTLEGVTTRNRWWFSGPGGNTITIAGTDSRGTREFRMVLEWQRKPIPADFDLMDWNYLQRCG